MKDLNNISVEPTKNSKARITGLVLLIVEYLYYAKFRTAPDMPVGISWLVNIAFLAMTVSVSIWVMNIALQLHRNAVWWGIFALLIPPLALIIIGSSDVKIDNKELKSIRNNCRAEYIKEDSYIRQDQSLSDKEFQKKIQELKQKHDKILQRKLTEYGLQ